MVDSFLNEINRGTFTGKELSELLYSLEDYHEVSSDFPISDCKLGIIFIYRVTKISDAL